MWVALSSQASLQFIFFIFFALFFFFSSPFASPWPKRSVNTRREYGWWQADGRGGNARYLDIILNIEFVRRISETNEFPIVFFIAEQSHIWSFNLCLNHFGKHASWSRMSGKKAKMSHEPFKFRLDFSFFFLPKLYGTDLWKLKRALRLEELIKEMHVRT